MFIHVSGESRQNFGYGERVNEGSCAHLDGLRPCHEKPDGILMIHDAACSYHWHGYAPGDICHGFQGDRFQGRS